MKLRNRILSGTGILLFLGLAVFAVLLSYTADCKPVPAASAAAETMRAIIQTCYGPPEVLEFATVLRPVPGEHDVLVRIQAAAVNPLDWHYLRGKPYVMRLMSGIGRPTSSRVGVDFAGTVEAVGGSVTRFKPGDEVFGGANGAFAEYVLVGEDGSIALKPANVGFDEAAAVPVAGVTALQALRDAGGLEAGDRLLVNGASGGVGPFAVQLGKYFGAEVTGVASAKNRALVLDLGADRFIDYRTSDYTAEDVEWDVIIDNVGNQPLLANKKVMAPDGVLVMVGGGDGNWIGPLLRPLSAVFVNPFVEPEFAPFLAHLTGEDLAFLAERMAEGSVTTVVDRRYTLEEVPEAIRYSEGGHARAKIVIRVASGP
jgi:NADPH:quinone reductase-like Zn-dependent oxidoreductase